MTASRYLRFGAFCLDCLEGRLWRHATPLALSRKPHGLLTLLATRAGELVTKDALLNVVWPRAVVVEAVLTTAVRDVRRALGDDARRPRFIETVHGRGYRFIAPVLADSVPANDIVDGDGAPFDAHDTVTLVVDYLLTRAPAERAHARRTLMALCATLDERVDARTDVRADARGFSATRSGDAPGIAQVVRPSRRDSAGATDGSRPAGRMLRLAASKS